MNLWGKADGSCVTSVDLSWLKFQRLFFADVVTSTSDDFANVFNDQNFIPHCSSGSASLSGDFNHLGKTLHASMDFNGPGLAGNFNCQDSQLLNSFEPDMHLHLESV